VQKKFGLELVKFQCCVQKHVEDQMTIVHFRLAVPVEFPHSEANANSVTGNPGLELEHVYYNLGQ